MSDAILTFQSQLSGVMETVFKAAMYEITRLVEDSFLEEVSRSREQVESLRQRLQWSESRRREREGGGGRSRCADCGRAAVSSEDTEDRPSGAQSGVDEGRGLKQEKVPEGSWSSCPGEVSTSNPGPPSAPEDLAPPSPVRASESSAAAPTDLEGGRPDSLLKEEEEEDEEEEEEPQEMAGDDIQGTWLPCSEGAVGASALCERLGEQEWSPGTRQDTAPPSGRLPPEQQGAGETYGLYVPESESVVHGLLLAVEQRRNDPDSEPEPWTEFKLRDVDNETHGLDPSYATDPAAQTQPRPALAEEGAGDCAPPPQCLHVKSEGGVAVKEEFDARPVCGEEGGWDVAHTHHRRHRDTWDTGETQVEHAGHSPPAQDAMKRLQSFSDRVDSLQSFSDRVDSLTLQLRQRQQQQGQSLKPSQMSVSRSTAAVSTGRIDREGCVSHDTAFTQSENTQLHQRAPPVERPYSCTRCGKSFSRLPYLKEHLKTHTGEKPFSCIQCGRGFTKLSNLKAHRRVHTGERPYICTNCGKRFTLKSNLKRHQRIHTGERLFSYK